MQALFTKKKLIKKINWFANLQSEAADFSQQFLCVSCKTYQNVQRHLRNFDVVSPLVQLLCEKKGNLEKVQKKNRKNNENKKNFVSKSRHPHAKRCFDLPALSGSGFFSCVSVGFNLEVSKPSNEAKRFC